MTEGQFVLSFKCIFKRLTQLQTLYSVGGKWMGEYGAMVE